MAAIVEDIDLGADDAFVVADHHVRGNPYFIAATNKQRRHLDVFRPDPCGIVVGMINDTLADRQVRRQAIILGIDRHLDQGDVGLVEVLQR